MNNNYLMIVSIFGTIFLYFVCGYLVWKIWCLTFLKKWLYNEYGSDVILWILVLWPISLLVYILIMFATIIIKISLICKKKR